jgi:Alkylmercury lyase
MVTHSSLHYTIIKHIIDKGYAPDVHELAQLLSSSATEVENGLQALQEYHGVVLHPHEPKVWVIHPFSLAPTNFLVRSAWGVWWGNCAWCSLGVAALLNEDVTITTRLGAYDEQVVLHIVNGELQEKDFYIHFPIAMKNAWDNVMYTCSNMLLFKNEEQITAWSERHRIPKGDVQPIKHIWHFSKKWYGNHLNPHWKKWTMQEAKEIFQEFHLTGKIWDLEENEGRF